MKKFIFLSFFLVANPAFGSSFEPLLGNVNNQNCFDFEFNSQQIKNEKDLQAQLKFVKEIFACRGLQNYSQATINVENATVNFLFQDVYSKKDMQKGAEIYLKQEQEKRSCLTCLISCFCCECCVDNAEYQNAEIRAFKALAEMDRE